MPLYRVTIEDVAFCSLGREHDPIELELHEQFLEGYSRTRRDEKTFPEQVLAVLKATTSPDSEGGSGREADEAPEDPDDDDAAKLFVSIDLLIDADSPYDFPDMSKLLGVLTHVTDAISTDLHLENNWEVLEDEEYDFKGRQWLEAYEAFATYEMDTSAPSFPLGEKLAPGDRLEAILKDAVLVYERTLGPDAARWRLTKAGEIIRTVDGLSESVERDEAMAILKPLMEVPTFELFEYQFEHYAKAMTP